MHSVTAIGLQKENGQAILVDTEKGRKWATGSRQAREAQRTRPRDRHAGHTSQKHGGWSERPGEAGTLHGLGNMAKECSPVAQTQQRTFPGLIGAQEGLGNVQAVGKTDIVNEGRFRSPTTVLPPVTSR